MCSHCTVVDQTLCSCKGCDQSRILSFLRHVSLPHEHWSNRNSLMPLLALVKEVKFYSSTFQSQRVRRKVLERLFRSPVSEMAGGMSLSTQKVRPEDEAWVVRSCSPTLGCFLVTQTYHFFTPVCQVICKTKCEWEMRASTLDKGKKQF